MRLYNSSIKEIGYTHNDTNVTAVCNTSAPVDTNYYEGYVSIDNLSIMVDAGGYLTIWFDPNCSEFGCLFQPAIVNETSSHVLDFFDPSNKKIEHMMSLTFAATIVTEGIIGCCVSSFSVGLYIYNYI